MYKVGYTSGLTNKSSDEGKSTIKIIGDVLPKMIKTVEDCPKKILAENKILEITDGCFSSASVLSIKDEKASSESSTSSTTSNAENAAAITGSAGGSKTSSQVSSSNKSATKSASNASCVAGPATSGATATVNTLTGENLVDMYTPATVSDMINSDCMTVLQSDIDAATGFKSKFCNLRPYPECATCPYATGSIGSINKNLSAIFDQIRTAMQVLQNGMYELAEHMFQCPGQLALLMRGDIGGIARVAAANTVYAVISLVSARGALSIFGNIATYALATDFRREIMYALSSLLRSGSNVARTKGFVNAINGILTAIGCRGSSLTRLKSGSGSSRSSRFGAGYNLCGNKGNGTTNSNTRAKNPSNTAKVSRVTGKPVDYTNGAVNTDTTVDSGISLNVVGAGEVADTDGSVIPTVYQSGGRKPVSSESTAKADAALEKVSDALLAAAQAVDDPANSTVTPASSDNNFTRTSDTTAQTGKTYYRAVTDSSSTTTKYEEVPVSTGDDLSSVVAKYGSLYEREDSGINQFSLTEVTDTCAAAGRIYYYYDPATGEYVKIEVSPGDLIEDIKRKIAIKTGMDIADIKLYYRIDSDSSSDYYEPTTDTSPVAGITYYTLSDTGEFIELDVSSGEFPSGVTIYQRISNPSGYDPGCAELTSKQACLLDSGLMIAESASTDICNDTLSVDTRSIVTQTHVLAEDIAQIYGINMSIYEIKMAYLLDHIRNGSILPADVTGELIPTILDTISDND